MLSRFLRRPVAWMSRTRLFRAVGPRIAARNPTGRWGEPEEIAGAAVFLASNAASYVNGHALVVDGGLSIQF